MRIGIDASRGFEGELTGTERYAYEMISRIVALPKAKTTDWVLYVRKGQKGAAERFKRKNVEVVEISLPVLWTQVGLAARTWMDDLDVLWVPAHTLPVLRRGIWGLGRKLETVVTVHGIEYEWLPAYENRLQRWYLPYSTVYAVREATRVVAVSEYTREQLIKRLKAKPEKIQVVWEGYERNEMETKKPTQDTKMALLKKYDLQKNRYFLFVGTVQPRKNVKRLIQAFLKLNKKDYKLVICGKLGWNYGDVTEIIRENKGLKVVLTGYVDEEVRRGLLSNSAVYVQPSITEGFGLPILEAMESGIPVAASNGGALPEVVGKAGLMFDPFNVDEMARAMGKVATDLGLRKRLKMEGKKQLGKFGWDRAAAQVFEILTYKK